MTSTFVIADDLTGANAVGVQLISHGFSSQTVLIDIAADMFLNSKVDALIKPIPSRTMSPTEAYQHVFDTIKEVHDVPIKLYSKRIDSTLRGNVGSETDAFLDALGDKYLALIVPSFPSAGRTVVGGYLLVNGVPLDKTAVSEDPTNSVSSARVSEIFKKQSKRDPLSISLEDLRTSAKILSELLISIYAKGIRVVICDAVDEQDLIHLAEAVELSELPVLSVDPGAFTGVLARKLLKKNPKSTELLPCEEQKKSRVLALIGSVNPVAAVQVKQLEELMPVTIIVKSKALLNLNTRQKEIERVVRLGCESKSDLLLIVGDGIHPDKKLDLSSFDLRSNDPSLAAAKINDGFASIGKGILDNTMGINSLLTSGGDTTLAIYKQLEAEGISLETEIVPLGAFGYLAGGPYDGLAVVTKGGMVGNSDALVVCAEYLLKQPTC